MRPIVVKGHERPLTQVRFNREGDILFTSARDCNVSVWWSSNGERIGTLNDHPGAVFTVDVTADTRIAITGAAGPTINFWDVKSGTLLKSMDTETTPRFISISDDGKRLLAVMSEQLRKMGNIQIFDLDDTDSRDIKCELTKRIERGETSAFLKAAWSIEKDIVVAAHDDGSVSRVNVVTGEILQTKKIHQEKVTDIQMSADRSYFVTSSRDKFSHLLDSQSLEILKTYKADVPLNSATITPVKDFIIAGGGIDARNVTTSADGRFESHFFHKIFEEDLGRLPGHFGPINTIAVHPHGHCFVTGGEDGYVRINYFDQSYFDLNYGIGA